MCRWHILEEQAVSAMPTKFGAPAQNLASPLTLCVHFSGLCDRREANRAVTLALQWLFFRWVQNASILTSGGWMMFLLLQ